MSYKTTFADPQSIFSPNKILTASITITTADGGLGKLLIKVISFLLIVFKACSASLKAGKAMSNSC